MSQITAAVRRQPAGALIVMLAATLAVTGCNNTPVKDTTPVPAQTASGLHYDVAGAGPPVVLIHGAMLDHRQWQPQRDLAQHFTVIRYDTRWHGQSQGADSTFNAADDLAEVMNAAGVQKAALVGLSNGASIATDFALQYPARVERLVLASPGLSGYAATDRPIYFQPMIDALGAQDYVAAATALAYTPVMEVGPADSEWVVAMVRDQASVFQQDPSRERPLNPPAITRLTELRMPVLVITGDDDMRDILLIGDTLMHMLPNAQRLTVPGAKHLLNITHAAQFNTAVVNFLKPPTNR